MWDDGGWWIQSANLVWFRDVHQVMHVRDQPKLRRVMMDSVENLLPCTEPPNTTSNKKLMQLVFNVTEAWYSTYTWSIPRDWGVLGFVLHKQRTPFIYGVIVPRPCGVLGFVLFKQRNPFRSGCTTVGLWSFGTPRIMKLCPPQTEPLFNSVAPVLNVFYSLYILVT